MLSIKNISFYYDKIKIVDNFSYQFEKGKIYGIFGRSGLGKTTLARIISGFLQPSEGEVSLDYKKITSPSRDIVYVSQKDDTFYRLTIYDNLYLLCHDKMKINHILKEVDLYDYKDRFPKELSGGMIRRLSFARILLLNPKILILDEPFVHLDIKAKEKLIHLLSVIHKINNHMTILLISHNMNEMKMADTMIFFQSSINGIYKEKKFKHINRV